MIGIEKSYVLCLSTIAGINGFSCNFTKQDWLIGPTLQQIGALLVRPFLPMSKLSTVTAKDVIQKFLGETLNNGS